MNIPLSILNAPATPRPRESARLHDTAPAPAPARERAGVRRLIDSHGRTIRDLRLSITDRCNFRCVYCMDPGVRFMEREELLSASELLRVARVCVGLGVRKVRITGGEPSLHPDLADIIRGLRRLGGIDIAMTTNASHLDEDTARAWRGLGLDRLTISLDAAEASAFRAMTRASVSVERVIDGARSSLRAGLGPVKLNAVIVRGRNEDQIVPLAALARELGVEMRFIEFMPLDSSRAWEPSLLVPGDEILARIGRVWALKGVGRPEADSTATRHEFADGAPGGIGIIAPVTRPFCGACSRLRVTADGKVRACLFSLVEHDLRGVLRSSGDEIDRRLEDVLLDATWSKQAGHGISAPGFVPPARTMSAIGG